MQSYHNRYGVTSKKKILVISPDTLPLKYFKDKVDLLPEEERELFINKVTRAVSLGERAYNTANELSKSFDVTVAVPTYNYFHEECINTSELFFNIITYDWDAACRKFSSELASIINDYEIIVLQTSVVGFHNCIDLPQEKTLVVDGWVPLGIENATAIGCLVDTQDKEVLWEDFKSTYFKLLGRADVLLYANLGQKYYYLGILNSIDYISYKNYKHTNLLKAPVSVGRKDILNITYKKGEQFNLVWFGSAYGWYNPWILIDAFNDFLISENITLTFVGCNRFKRFNNPELTEKLKSSKNISFIDQYKDIDSLTGFHLGMVLSYNYLERHLAQRYRSLQLASVGLPICTNKQDHVGMLLEKYSLCHSVLTHTPKQLAQSILSIRDNYTPPAHSTVKNFQNSLSHKKSFEALVGYLNGDSKWRLL